MYLGTDEVLDRPVAIKVLKSEYVGSDIGFRFRREGRTAARLSHPNIVQVYDAGEDELDGENLSYIVMEHVSGGDLRDLISQRGTLSAAEVSNLSAAAAGLAHAHERGVVHRDIKPHNILLDENGQPKLTDFGIARALDATRATQTGMYMGTARYSSPEQLKGEEITPKSDVYSLGATLYEAVTGAPPFSGTPIEIATQHVSKPPAPPGGLNSAVDPELEALILDCLAKEPDSRPATDEVRDRLAAVGRSTGDTRAPATRPVAGPASAQSGRPTPANAPGRRRPGRSAVILAGLALLAAVVLAGALGAPTLLGGGEDQAWQPSPEAAGPPATNQQEEQNPANGAGSQGEEAAPEPPEQQPARQEPAPVEQGGDLTEKAAAQTVEEVYKAAASGDYERSYSLLSQDFRQSQAPTQAQWSSQFATLEKIKFVEKPTGQVTGNAAQVTGVTRAVHADRTERNTAAWTLVREGGEWKLDGVNIISRELV